MFLFGVSVGLLCFCWGLWFSVYLGFFVVLVGLMSCRFDEGLPIGGLWVVLGLGVGVLGLFVCDWCVFVAVFVGFGLGWVWVLSV